MKKNIIKLEESKKKKIALIVITAVAIIIIAVCGLILFQGNFDILKNDTATNNYYIDAIKTPKCKEGFTYNDETNKCEKIEDPVFTCKMDGYKYNEETQKCEYKYNSYTCPSGYDLIGGVSGYCQSKTGTKVPTTTCTDKHYTYNSKTKKCENPHYSYSCPSGYQMIGGGSSGYCQKKVQVATTTCTDKHYTYNSKTKKCENTHYSYSCPSGYQMIGGGSSGYCQSKYATKIATTTCTDKHYTYNNKTKKCENIHYSYSCPSGYQMIGGGSSGKCQSKTATKSCSSYGSKYILSGNNCIYTYKAQKRGKSYTCNNGGTLKNGKCTIKKNAKKTYKTTGSIKKWTTYTMSPKMKTVYKTTGSIKSWTTYTMSPKMKTEYKTTGTIKKLTTYTMSPKMKTEFKKTNVISTPKVLYTPVRYKCKNGTKTNRNTVNTKCLVQETPTYEYSCNSGKLVNNKCELSSKLYNEINGNNTINNLNRIAESQLGNSGEIYQDYSDLDSSSDWCAAFIFWLFNQDNNAKNLVAKDATADGIVRESIKKGYGTWHEDKCYTDKNNIPTYIPKAGDLIVFDPEYNNTGYYIPYPLRITENYPSVYGFNDRDEYLSSHIGYVYKVDSNYVYTYEGNRGNIVAAMKYSIDYCGEHASTEQRINGYYTPNYNK